MGNPAAAKKARIQSGCRLTATSPLSRRDGSRLSLHLISQCTLVFRLWADSTVNRGQEYSAREEQHDIGD